MSRDTLNQALQIVKAFDGRCLPILSTVLLEYDQGKLVLTTTDLESGIRFTLYPEMGVDSWQTCVPVKKLADLIKERGGYPILTLGDDYKLKIETAEGDVTITGMDPSDFPEWSRPDKEEYVNLPVDTFLDLESLPRTADKDRKRYCLDNVNFSCEHYSEGKAITCDGHRINTVKTRWLPETWNFMIPAQALRKTIGAIKKLRRQMSEVELFRSEKGLTIIAGPMEIWLRFTEGEYPDTSKFEANGPTAQVKTSELVKALRQVKIMTSNPTPGATLQFRRDRLELWSVHPDIGTAFTWINADVQDELVGKTALFNVGYMMEAVKKCNGTVRIVSNLAPKAVWQFGPEFIMPMVADHNDVTRPDIAPPIEEPIRQLEEPVKALPVDNWRTDPTADPGPGFEWEPASDYFPAHWARVA